MKKSDAVVFLLVISRLHQAANVRQLIGDGSKEQKPIRTIHGRGFQFVSERLFVEAKPLTNEERVFITNEGDGSCLESIRPNPHSSPEGKMIAQRFVSTRDFATKRNTGCISEGRKFLVETKIKRGSVILV